MSIYGGRRSWSDLNDVVQPVVKARTAEVATRIADSDARWASVRKAQPADYLLPQSEKWFDSLPPGVAPCALATHYPRIVNSIVAQWKDHLSAPDVFADLLGDRRGGRAGFPPAVRRDIENLQDYWYSGRVELR